MVLLDGREVREHGERSWIKARCLVLLDGGEEVDGMVGNTEAALLVGRAKLEKDTIAATGRESRGWDGWEHSGAGGGMSVAGGAWCCWTGERYGKTVAALVVRRVELDTDTVRGAAGRKRGGWVGWLNGRSAAGESGAE